MTGILAVQITPTIGAKDINLRKAEHFIKKNADKNLDLVVLPEFFSTGISHECFLKYPEDEYGGDTIKHVAEFAKRFNTNIVAGTVIEKSGDKLYNTTFVINRDGDIVEKYRKIHLYNYFGGTEGEIITAGNEIKTAELDFGKIGLAICYDIRYPRHYQNLARENVEITVLPTAWCIPNKVYDNPQSLEYAKDMWIAINRTRAYDNQFYTVSCNQTKRNNEQVSSIGTSLIVAPNAEIIANAKDAQCGIYANIDLQGAKYYKSLCPAAQTD